MFGYNVKYISLSKKIAGLRRIEGGEGRRVLLSQRRKKSKHWGGRKQTLGTKKRRKASAGGGKKDQNNDGNRNQHTLKELIKPFGQKKKGNRKKEGTKAIYKGIPGKTNKGSPKTTRGISGKGPDQGEIRERQTPLHGKFQLRPRGGNKSRKDHL